MKKKALKKVAVVLAVLVVVLGLASCGADMSGSPYIGIWSATTAEYSGIEMSVESIIGGEFTVTLEDDGGCTLNIAGEENTGKWSEIDGGFNVADEFDFIVDGDVATMDYDGIIMNFER